MQIPEIKEQNKLKDCSKERVRPQPQEIVDLMRAYGVSTLSEIGMIDSSRDADDIRWNYVIDRTFVLRFCNAPEMTEQRMEDLNRLIERYRAFGFQCPAFRKNANGSFFLKWQDLTVYLSDYIDLPLGVDVAEEDKDALREEIDGFIVRFMERYKDVDLIPTMGLYSLFDLCPFDVPLGIDEKQQNLNNVCHALRATGEDDLAQRLAQQNEAVRAYLLTVYRTLPHCVTQGDENLSNVLVDGRHVAGLIDFNLAGTDVCVNLIANNADFALDLEHDRAIDPDEVLCSALANYRRNAEKMLSDYRATEAEREALPYYAWIVLASQYPYACAYIDRIGKAECRESTLAFLDRLAKLDPAALAV